MKLLFVLALTLAAVSGRPEPRKLKTPTEEWADFKVKFGKVYRDIREEASRFQIFQDNLKRIEQHNSEPHSWIMGVTKFADLTKEEFVATLNYRPIGSPRPGQSKSSSRRSIDVEWSDQGAITPSSLPTEVDWREQGVITPVRDQGMCGSCWAFAAAAQMSSYAKINNMSHALVELSPQHLVSCTPNPLKCGGTGGCMGSVEPLAFTYASLFGVVTEEEYPYTSGDPWGAGDDEICRFDGNKQDVTVMVMGFETLPHNEMEPAMEHLANVGPLAASVAASEWGLYFGGVFDGCPYDQNIAVNHAVQLIGYGTDPTDGDYWLIKNSWGDMWGDGWESNTGGYIKLKRNGSPQCGTNHTPLDGNACVNAGVTQQHVCGTCAVLFDNSYPIGTTFMK